MVSGLLAAFFCLPGAAAARPGPVVVSEVHYHPREGSDLEFVELHNLGGEPVHLGGWSLARGVNFVFPESAAIEPRGYVLVAKNRVAASFVFGTPEALLFGEYAGSLDNSGEGLDLLDREGTVVDRVSYRDCAPWDARADGEGPSLERVCLTLAGDNPGNWIAATGFSPTPLGPCRFAECPPPRLVPKAISIHEVYYHPVLDKDAQHEFVELRNLSDRAIDLAGYRFSEGIDFAFEESLVVPPGGYVVVCRDAAAVRSAFGIEERVVGNFAGQLSNSGERITVVDPRGELVDTIRYADCGDWPVAADSLGYSLEKIVATAVSDDPASWCEAGLANLDGWVHVDAVGIATSNTLLVYLDGEGEVLLDNFRLVNPAIPETNHLPNGSFDGGIDGWVGSGNHADTRWDPEGGLEGGALRLVSTGRGSGSRQGIAVEASPALERSGPEYRLSFDFRHVRGSKGLTCRLNVATATRGLYWTLLRAVRASPGGANAAAADRLPPFVSDVRRSPREPTSEVAVEVSARVRAAMPLASVRLFYRVDGGAEETAVDMADAGGPVDLWPVDRVYAAQLPPLPHNSLVTFRIVAEDAGGAQRTFPAETDPAGSYGYYVNDLQPESPLPVYHVLLDPKSTLPPRTILGALDCSVYRQGAFAYKGDLYPLAGIRQRGQSVCRSTKPFLKVNFPRGRLFKGQDKINLQSLWTDKSLVREVLAWQTFRDVGMPYCEEEHVRLHVNGKYFGLYAHLEHPDHRFLRRNGLAWQGNLYKAVASTEQPMANYQSGYEKKTNQEDDFSDITEFLNSMHATPRARLVEFFTTRADPDRIIDYQLAQTLTNNSDYPHKNHYLYHDTEADRWMVLTWDMDLTFGKIWDGTYGGVLHDKMHTPGNNPWYTTSVDGGLGNHLLDKFFAQAGTWFRRAYIVRLWDALQEKYTLDFFDGRIQHFRELLLDEQAQDIAVWGRTPATADDPTAPKDFEPNLARVREHVRQRRIYLLNYLASREKFTGHDRLKITEAMYNPPGGGDELEFLELWNPTGKEIDVSGWTIEGIGFAFPEGTRIAKDEIIVVAKDPEAFAAAYAIPARVFGPYPGQLSNGGQIVRVKDAGPGHPATVDFLRYGTSGDWPREADGGGRSIELVGVTATRDNDLGIYWRASREDGGSPGEVEGVSPPRAHFRRGDPNADGRTNVSDALAVIRYAFGGASADLPCVEAADFDANGLVGVPDVVGLLRYLFDPAAPPPPSPGPGECLPWRRLPCRQSTCEPL